MADGESKGQTHDPNTFKAKYLKISFRCYLATVANYQIVCCGAVLSAIVATAWLLVYNMYTLLFHSLPLHTS